MCVSVCVFLQCDLDSRFGTLDLGDDADEMFVVDGQLSA